MAGVIRLLLSITTGRVVQSSSVGLATSRTVCLRATGELSRAGGYSYKYKSGDEEAEATEVLTSRGASSLCKRVYTVSAHELTRRYSRARTAAGRCQQSLSTVEHSVGRNSQTTSPGLVLATAPSWCRGGLDAAARALHCSSAGKRDVNDLEDTQHIRFDKENIFTVPNVLSLGRMVLAPVLAYLVVTESFGLALGLFALAGVSDVLDGYIARNFKNQSSMLGSVLDPLADKLLVSSLCVSLTVANLLPLPLTIVMLGRDAVLVAGGFYLRYVTLPPPRTWSRYWDIKRSTIQITPSLLGKVNTLLQLSLVGLSLGAPVVGMVAHPALQALWYLTGVTTVSSGLGYVLSMGGFQVLRKNKHTEEKNMRR